MVRVVTEVRSEDEAEWAAMQRVAELVGVASTEAVRQWVRRAEVDAGERAGTTSGESAELKGLRRENAGLKRANAVLKPASAFLPAGLDRPGHWSSRSSASTPAAVTPQANGGPRWGSSRTYVSTWAGWVYVAFVTDAYARRVLGWRCGTTMTAQLVLDAPEQAIRTRQRTGASLESVVAHSDRGSRYGSLRYGERLADAGTTPPVGSVGDSHDNALAETINGLYKTEPIKHRAPWKTVDDVETATTERVDRSNHRHPYEHRGDIPPTELEAAYYAQEHPQAVG